MNSLISEFMFQFDEDPSPSRLEYKKGLCFRRVGLRVFSSVYVCACVRACVCLCQFVYNKRN